MLPDSVQLIDQIQVKTLQGKDQLKISNVLQAFFSNYISEVGGIRLGIWKILKDERKNMFRYFYN